MSLCELRLSNNPFSRVRSQVPHSCSHLSFSTVMVFGCSHTQKQSSVVSCCHQPDELHLYASFLLEYLDDVSLFDTCHVSGAVRSSSSSDIQKHGSIDALSSEHRKTLRQFNFGVMNGTNEQVIF